MQLKLEILLAFIFASLSGGVPEGSASGEQAQNDEILRLMHLQNLEVQQLRLHVECMCKPGQSDVPDSHVFRIYSFDGKMRELPSAIKSIANNNRFNAITGELPSALNGGIHPNVARVSVDGVHKVEDGIFVLVKPENEFIRVIKKVVGVFYWMDIREYLQHPDTFSLIKYSEYKDKDPRLQDAEIRMLASRLPDGNLKIYRFTDSIDKLYSELLRILEAIEKGEGYPKLDLVNYFDPAQGESFIFADLSKGFYGVCHKRFGDLQWSDINTRLQNITIKRLICHQGLYEGHPVKVHKLDCKTCHVRYVVEDIKDGRQDPRAILVLPDDFNPVEGNIFALTSPVFCGIIGTCYGLSWLDMFLAQANTPYDSYNSVIEHMHSKTIYNVVRN